MKYMFGVLLLILSASINAKNLTQEQYSQLQTKFQDTDIAALVADIDGLNSKLSGLSPHESTLLKSKVLTYLSTIEPDEKQKDWVQSNLASRQIITTEHPENLDYSIEVVNIANQSRATQNIWKIDSLSDTYMQQWNLAIWDWKQYIQNESSISKRAFSRALHKADGTSISWLAESVKRYISENNNVPNYVLAQLANLNKDQQLYIYLWQKPADEYSYQALQKVPSNLNTEQSVGLLQMAAKNTQLQSQAYSLLVSQHSSNVDAQEVLLRALGRPETEWQVATILSQVDAQYFKQKIKSVAKGKGSKASQYLISRFERESK